jgi:hypothetical protein
MHGLGPEYAGSLLLGSLLLETREASRSRTNGEEIEVAGEHAGMKPGLMEKQASDEGDSGDFHMTPAMGVESKNYYTALDKEEAEA